MRESDGEKLTAAKRFPAGQTVRAPPPKPRQFSTKRSVNLMSEVEEYRFLLTL